MALCNITKTIAALTPLNLSNFCAILHNWNYLFFIFQCLVFEDATLGVQAAKAAHMYAVLIPDKRLDLSSIQDIVDQVIGSMEEFVPEEWGLPAYDAWMLSW